eukprot:Amastigsp_a340242_81.p2 type:complete len:106 gc:universal Amastigsp_a340242_81:239-556(+)
MPVSKHLLNAKEPDAFARKVPLAQPPAWPAAWALSNVERVVVTFTAYRRRPRDEKVLVALASRSPDEAKETIGPTSVGAPCDRRTDKERKREQQKGRASELHSRV